MSASELTYFVVTFVVITLAVRYVRPLHRTAPNAVAGIGDLRGWSSRASAGRSERDMRDIPKIELHLHLEGGAPPAFIRGIAREKHVDLSGIFREDGGYTYRDFSGISSRSTRPPPAC